MSWCMLKEPSIEIIVHIFELDLKNAFEIVDRDQPKAVFTCKTEEEKNEWMSVLMTIYMRR